MAALVCDPQAGVMEYEIEINGTALTPFPSEADGSARYELDSTFAPGTYAFRLRARGTGGWYGDWSLPLAATKPASPVGLRIAS
jgi:hypothetical protein